MPRRVSYNPSAMKAKSLPDNNAPGYQVSLKTYDVMVLKGHSQLAHMRIRYHFIANLHITETRAFNEI